jgi:hypothetical protein
MRKLTTYLVVTLVFAIISLSAFGQKKYLDPEKQYSVAKIYKKDFKILKVGSLKQINDSTISFKNKLANKTEQLSIDQIKYFSVKVGTKALPFALYGAGLGAFSIGLASLKVAGDPNYEFRDNLGLRITLFVGGCAAIGAGIGALVPKWKRMYILKNDQSTSFIFYPAVYKDYYCVGLTINF